MSFDFEVFLVLATVITGIISLWNLIQRIWLQRKHQREPGKEGLLVEYSKSFFPVLLIVLLLRSFIAEPFRIPSGSMLPTLEVGDFILVSKFSYGLRLPISNQVILTLGQPERGDVAVFKYPENPHIDYIKRIIGVPGDTLEYKDKQLWLNGEKVATEFVEPYGKWTSRGGPGTFGQYIESLPNKTHNILLHPLVPSQDFSLTVPPGHYFVMGDNRDDSRDSRVWGFLPDTHLVGKAFLVWMHWNFKQKDKIDGSRIGQLIK